MKKKTTNCLNSLKVSRMVLAFVLPLAFLFSSFEYGWSQTESPGGETANLNVWYRADKNVDCTTNACNVAVWNTYGASPSDSLLRGRPLAASTLQFGTGAFNFNPGVNIVDNYLAMGGRTFNDLTIYVVFRTSESAVTQANWWDQPAIISAEQNGGNIDWGMTMDVGDLHWNRTAGDATAIAVGGPFNNNRIRVATVRRDTNGGASDFFIDGAAGNSGNGNTISGTYAAPDSIYIGGHPLPGNAGNWDGEIAEIILYDAHMDGARRQQVHTYLAIKYGVEMADDYEASDGTVVFLDNAYNHETVGIARDDQSGLDQRQSKPAGDGDGLAIYLGTGYSGTFPAHNNVGTDTNVNTIATDLSYLVVGHDDDNTNITQNFGGGAMNRVDRLYRAFETGTVGPVTVYFDGNEFPMVEGGQYYFIESNNAIFGLPDKFHPLYNIPGTDNFYAEVDFPAGESFFAIVQHDAAPANHTNNLNMWHKADGLVDCFTDGCGVTDWDDEMGDPDRDGASAGAGTVTLEHGEMNSNPVVRIDNARVQFPATDGGTRFMDQDFTIIVVAQTTYNGMSNSNDWWNMGALYSGDADDDTDFLDWGMTLRQGGRAYMGVRNDWDVEATGPYNDGASHLFLADRNSQGGNNDYANLRVDGVQWPQGDGGADDDLDDINSFRIGRHPDGDGRLDADYAEIISYEDLLSAGERDRIESYLGIKYGITLTHDYVNYNASETTYAIAGYGDEVVGIGTDFRTALDQRQSRPANNPSGLGIYNGGGFGGVFPAHNNRGNDQNPNILLDGQFLVSGHDGNGVAFDQTYDGFPNTMTQRIYKVTSTDNAATGTGSPGVVTLLFDDGTFTGLQAGINYKMLVSTDQTMTVGDLEVDLIPVPSSAGDFYCEYTFPDGDTYFTLIQPSEGGPGGVDSLLTLWVRGDLGTGGPTSPFTWTDFSGNANNMVTSAPLPTVSVNSLVNYNPYVHVTDTLENNFLSDSLTPGESVFFVARTTPGANPNPVLMGWQGAFRLVGSSSLPDPLVDNSNSPGSNFLFNGAIFEDGSFKTVSADIDEWAVVTAMSGAAISGDGRFHLGAFTGQSFYNSHDFSEIIVLDTAPNNTQRQRIQSYLAIRHGLTLSDVYRDSDGTLIYNPLLPTTFSNNIIAIGRDDASLLSQRQSKSEHPDGIISIGVDDIVATNQANAGLLNDKEFLFLANDGGASCLTTLDSNYLGLNLLVVDRKWKFTPVGGFADTIDFEFDINDVDFDIGARPVSSSFYFLITDDDNDLTNGILDTLQFGAFVNPWNRRIASTEYTNGGNGVYFTLATYLVDSVWSFQDYCSGQNLELIGSFLVDSSKCVSLHFDDGSQSFNLFPGATSSDTSFTILSNTTGTSCLDTLSWMISDSFASLNNYSISIDTASGPCGTNPLIPTDALVYLDSLSIGSSGSSAFSYTPDSVCMGDPNILPVIPIPLGTPGQFYIDSSSNAQVALNPAIMLDNNGTIYVNPLADGFHRICYTLAGDCSAETCDSVTINPWVPLSLTVPNNQICIGAAPDTLLPNIPGGTFTSVPALLTPTFATSGAIDSQAELPGTYQVSYNITTPGTCYQPISLTIVISEPIRPVFSYPDTVICTNTLLTSILPVVLQLPNGGGNYSYNAAGAGILNLNTGNGEITLPSDPDVYFVSYNPTGGGCTTSDSVRIEIVDPPVITSFLLDTSYCIDNLNSVVIPAAPAGGIMEDLSGLMDSLFFNGTDWEILPRGPLGGPFPVRYTYTDPSTGCSQSQTQLTELVGVSIPTWAYDTTVYCLGSDSPPRPTLLSGQGGGTFSASIGITIDQNTGEIDTTGMTNNTQVTVFYTDTVNGCAIPVQTVTPTPIRFFTAPDPIFVLGGPGVDSLCPGIDTLLFSGATGSGQYSLWLGGVQVSSLSNTGIAINDTTFVPGANYEIRRIVSRNQAPGCRDSLSEYFYLHPLESAAFDYGMDSLTLCSNAPDVFPAMYGDGGGLFSSATAIIDNNSGQLFLDSTYTNDSTVTSHLVTYMTVGACPDTVTTLVRILPGRVTFFEYLSSIVCNNVPQFSPDSIATTGGTFSCPNCPFGVNIDQSTGAIDVGPVLSDITLEINYAFSDSTCADTTRRFIQVEAYDTGLSIDYPLIDYCPTGSEVPVITVSDTASVGVFLPVFGVNISDPVTGEIDLGSSTPGGYLVRYRLNGECAEIATDTVTVLEPDDAQFSYPTPTVCEGTDSLMGAVLDDSSSVGTFTWNYAVDPAVLTVDPLNGQIDLGNSDPGVFWVTHTSGGQCTEVDSQRVVISSLPNIGNLQVLPSDSVCGEDTIEVRITSGGIPLFIVDSVLIPNTPILTIENPVDGQVITGIVRTTDGCADTATVTITQNIVPRGDVGTWPNTVSGDEEIEIIIQALTDETSFTWTASSSDNVALETERDTTEMIDALEDVSIVNNVELESDYYPGVMEYAIVPFTENCRGDTIFLPIAINPNNQAIFIPGVFTPNGDTKNDTWQIQWRSDIESEQHIIEVYNRTGGLVYTMEGLISTWDGENLPDGVYWYLVKDPVGETIMAGGLTIRRR